MEENKENKEIKVLDKGFVKLDEVWGTDYTVLKTARMSTGAEETKGDVKDRGLIRYLWRKKHFSPFQQVMLRFHVKLPIFIQRQLVRHNIKLNEASARFKPFVWECFMPESLRKQDTVSKQNSYSDEDLDMKYPIHEKMIDSSYARARDTYNVLLEDGVANELARVTMPVSQYTELYFTQDLRSFLHMVEARTHPHAQKEIQVYAQAMYDLVKDTEAFKWACEIFEEQKNVNSVLDKLSDKYKLDLNVLAKKLEELL